ncbi:acetylglutamate kinase [Helicobacter sp. MIT 14-3879]|uniref:acetylglutamate kinase n=1 Tax=Helicobacter sp. MIT 14-3879 TaxID=2040649 RepID=UPI000E1F7F65|nr:acetylglutamate kinase [Helicobacter sp. MIT 14-3879]RDU65120.1 acetylglutamate kinase [Helicobacter sp. MIT 14-3879]
MLGKIKIANILVDSIPYIKKFRDSIIVIKYGGSAQQNIELKENFAKDIILLYMLGIKPVIIHGGGSKISSMLETLNIESKFINGIRVTSKEAMKVVEMVLSGDINRELVFFFSHYGIKAVGISGKDASMFEAKPKDFDAFGYVGEITKVNIDVLMKLLNDGFVPIISPIAFGDNINHPGFNINADSVACEIAKAINANKVIFLTDTKGILDEKGELIATLTPKNAKKYKDSSVITGGMIPKIDACISCIENGVKKVHIIDGRIPHSILLELFTSNGIGTQIINEQQSKS